MTSATLCNLAKRIFVAEDLGKVLLGFMLARKAFLRRDELLWGR
jgi:hypothetical protein